eukprot:TRINITY_DN37906_c0_g1_i1.p1 TRINITY_DN37906_c0_g1~~TRINITY_DN37906_c0_g1_i1.p1  ORF type:complete len:873 (+),score=237.17 TRINITY_DN37906_c0_g1_i1:86-2620(+)
MAEQELLPAGAGAGASGGATSEAALLRRLRADVSSQGVLRQMCNSLKQGHSAPVVAVAYWCGGQAVASACADGFMKLWDASDGALLAQAAGAHSAELGGGAPEVRAGAVTGGRFYWLASRRGVTAYAFDQFTPSAVLVEDPLAPVASFPAAVRGGATACCAVEECVAAAGHADGTVALLSSAAGTVQAELQGHHAEVTALCRCGDLLISAAGGVPPSEPAAAEDPKGAGGKKLDKTEALIQELESFDFLGTREAEIRVWSLTSRACLATMSGGLIRGAVRGLATYAGHTLYAVGENVTLWRIGPHPLIDAEWSNLHVQGQPHAAAPCSACTVSGDTLITGAVDGTLKVWSLAGPGTHGARPAVVRKLPAQEHAVRALASCTERPGILAAGDAAQISEWREPVPAEVLRTQVFKDPTGGGILEGYDTPAVQSYTSSSPMATALFVVGLALAMQQFLTLPFAARDTWSPAADPLTKTLPLLSLTVEFPIDAYLAIYWLSAVFFLLNIVVFFFCYTGILIHAQFLTSSLRLPPAKAAIAAPEDRAAWVANLRRRAAAAQRWQLLATVATKSLWLSCGPLFLPLLTKLLEQYACSEVDLGNSTNSTNLTAPGGQLFWHIVPNAEIECFQGAHLARTIIGSLLAVLMIPVAVKVMSAPDPRALVRIVYDNHTLRPATCWERLTGTPPRVAQQLPPKMREDPHGGPRIEVAMTALKVATAVLVAPLQNTGEKQAKAAALITLLINTSLCGTSAVWAQYHGQGLNRAVFTLRALAAWAGFAGVCAVFAAVDARSDGKDPPQWPAILGYAGGAVSALAGFCLYTRTPAGAGRDSPPTGAGKDADQENVPALE